MAREQTVTSCFLRSWTCRVCVCARKKTTSSRLRSSPRPSDTNGGCGLNSNASPTTNASSLAPPSFLAKNLFFFKPTFTSIVQLNTHCSSDWRPMITPPPPNVQYIKLCPLFPRLPTSRGSHSVERKARVFMRWDGTKVSSWRMSPACLSWTRPQVTAVSCGAFCPGGVPPPLHPDHRDSDSQQLVCCFLAASFRCGASTFSVLSSVSSSSIQTPGSPMVSVFSDAFSWLLQILLKTIFQEFLLSDCEEPKDHC